MRQSILIVEDDDELRGFLKKVLSTNNFKVLEAADGAEALELVEEDRPDLVLLDFGLSKVPGETVCVKIKKDHPEIIVIALTEKANSRDVVRGLQIGADDYISKPFVAEELIVRIDTRLKKAERKKNSPGASEVAGRHNELNKIILKESIILVALRLIFTEALFGISFMLVALLINFLGHYFDMTNLLLLYFAVFTVIIVFNIVIIFAIILRWQSEYVEVTRDGLIKHSGILYKKSQKYACNFVEAVMLDQSLLGRFFNYGTLELYDPSLKETIYMLNIANPKRNSELIEKIITKERIQPMPFVAG